MQTKPNTWLKDNKNFFGYLLLFIVGYFILDIIFSIILSLILNMFNATYVKSISVMSVSILVIRAIINIGYIVWFHQKFIDKTTDKPDKVNAKENFIKFFQGCIFGAFAITLVIITRYFFGGVDYIKLNKFALGIILGNLIIDFCTVLIEEYIFRKTLFLSVRKRCKNWIKPAIFASSLFAIAHISNNIGIIDLAFYFAFSIVLCCLIENLCNLWISIGCHLAWNYLASGGGIFDIAYKEDTVQGLLTLKLISLGIIIAILICLCVVLKKKRVTHKEYEYEKKTEIDEY